MDSHKGKINGEGPSFQLSINKPDDKTRTRHHNASTASSGIKATVPIEIPSSKSTTDKEAEMEVVQDFIDDFIDDVGPDSYSVVFYLGFLAVMGIALIGFICLPWTWITAFVAVLIGFIIFRHVSIKLEKPRPEAGRRWVSPRNPNLPAPSVANLPAVYFLYVLGSGGHTTEMLETIRRKFQGQANQHRRYVINIGDTDSLRRLNELELRIRNIFDDERRGTVDSFSLPRARRVHQPLFTAPFTCLATAFWAINALTREPDARPQTRHGRQFKYPHVIVTNGPATGFIVCVVAHLLKIFYLVPQNRLKMVYIESWARTRTLSLTGKLFWWSGIADMFCVQHEELARATGGVHVGQVTAPLYPPG